MNDYNFINIRQLADRLKIDGERQMTVVTRIQRWKKYRMEGRPGFEGFPFHQMVENGVLRFRWVEVEHWLQERQAAGPVASKPRRRQNTATTKTVTPGA